MTARYWICFLLQTAGAVVLLWKGVPLYRNLLSGEPDPGNRLALWALAVIGLIQPAFWVARRIPLEPRGPLRPVLGHLVMFGGRLAFAFVSGVFSAVFYTRFGQLHAEPFRMAILVAILFSMFCYTLEMERLGRTLS